MLFSLLFGKKQIIKGPVVDLKVLEELEGNKFNNYIPSVYYEIVDHSTHHIVGHCDLRLGMDDELYYAGNIGYNINILHRGHGYAYEACKLLFKEAKNKYLMDYLIITCSPDNIPSKKTLERLNGKLKETVDVPESHWLYQRGEKVKNIYQFQL